MDSMLDTYDEEMNLFSGSEKCSGPSSLASTLAAQITDEGMFDNSSPCEKACENLPVRGVFIDSRFFGPSHFLNSFIHFRRVHNQLHSLKIGDTSAAYKQCQTLSEVIVSQQTHASSMTSAIRDLLPTQHVADQLIQAYLRTFESVLRVLHVPSFLSECQSFWQQPDHASQDFTVRLLLVIAIGASFSPELCAPFNASAYLQNAEARLRNIDQSSWTTVSGVQNLCLVLLARLINPQPLSADFTSVSVDSLLRAAMRIGLHVSPHRLQPMSFYEQEIRRRLWATVLEIALEYSVDIGGLPLVSAQDIDFELPLNIPDEHFDQHTQDPPVPKPLDQPSHTWFQILLMQSYSVRLEITALINSPRNEVDYQQALELSTRLSGYCRSAHARLNIEAKTQSQRFPVRLLDLFMFRFLLAIHIPFSLKASSDPTLYFSRKVSLELALSILGGSARLESDDYTRAMTMGSGVFVSSRILAASVVCAELLCLLEEDTSAVTPLPGFTGHHSLRKVLEDVLDLSSRRLSQGIPDVDVALVFAGLAAQIDASEVGQPTDGAVSTALRKTLTECLETLKTRDPAIVLLSAGIGSGDDPSLPDMTSDVAWTAVSFNEWMSAENTMWKTPF